MSSFLKPVKLLPAREQVASILRKAILSRELVEGDIIALDATAVKLGVSVTPVREAFQLLQNDGLIRLRPNKVAIVLGISPKTIRDHYETRAVLEQEACRLVCVKHADITDIVDIYQQSVVALANNDGEAYSDCNQAFHMAIWTACGNEKIKTILSGLWNGLSMAHRVTAEAYARISIAEHKKILDALLSYDTDEASRLMRAHIYRSMENILTRFPEEARA